MVRLNDSVMKTDVDGEIVLLDSASGHYFGLNVVGSRMLDLAITLDGREIVVHRLLDEFDASEETLSRDYDALISDLVTKGLIVKDE